MTPPSADDAPHDTIAQRLIRFSVLVAAASGLLASAAFSWYAADGHVRDASARLHAAAGTLAGQAAAALAAGDLNGAEGLLQSFAGAGDAVAAVYDSKGQMVVSHRPPHSARLLPELALSPRQGRSWRRISEYAAVAGWPANLPPPPAAAPGAPASPPFCTVYLEQEVGWKGFLGPVLLTALGVAAGTALLGLVAGALAGSSVGGTLSELAALARTVALRRDFTLEAPVRRTDETGRLAVAINAMLREIGRHDAEREAAWKQAEGELRSLSATAQQSDDRRRALEREVGARESRLAAADTAARQADLHRDTFLEHLRAEMRDPLRGILDSARSLRRETGGNEAVRSGLLAIEGHGNHLLAAIDDAVDLSAAAGAALSLDPAPFDPEALLSQLGSVFRLRAKARGVSLSIDRVGALPPSVQGDGRRLRQALLSLLGNSLRFTAEGGRIELVVGPLKDRVRFEVRDTGLPFAETEADPRFAADAGFGLGTTGRLVALLGGTFKCRSAGKEGEANVFWFDLSLPAA